VSPAAKGTSFDRVRPRVATAEPARRPGQVDVEGKRALFSSAPPVPAFGSLSVECGGCGATSVLAAAQAVRTLLPSLHLPLLRRNRSYLRCPACGRWEWCHLTVRV
jgi:hypothetical protein